MLDAAIQVVLYGLLAGFTALGFASTLAVMPSGRLKALGFGAGFVGAQILTCSVLVTFGIVATGREDHPDLGAALEVALALALLALALGVHRRPANTNQARPGTRRSKARTQALLERLSRLRLLTTVVAGFLLGIGGPKRLVLTSLAATTIVTAGLGDADQSTLVVVYVTLGTALVSVPSILFLLLGKRVIALMEGAQSESVADSRKSPSTHSWHSPRSSSSTQPAFCSPDAGAIAHGGTDTRSPARAPLVADYPDARTAPSRGRRRARPR